MHHTNTTTNNNTNNTCWQISSPSLAGGDGGAVRDDVRRHLTHDIYIYIYIYMYTYMNVAS